MSLVKAARACTESRSAHRTLNALIQWKDAELIELAAQAADERWNSGQQLSEIDGRLIAVKDNICTSDLPTTCASKALASFTSPYEATVVKKLAAAGAVISGKTNLDEFGMGSHSTNSVFAAVQQASGGRGADVLSAGGSSGGSAVAVQTGQCWAAIGTDTGGSIRLPAAYTGCVGFKPSYGIISRYGVIPYANSLDTVGILASSVDRVKAVFDVVRGYDHNDPTALAEGLRSKLAIATKTISRSTSLRIGLPIEYNIAELEPAVRQIWQDIATRLVDQGHQVLPVSLPSTKLALPTYYVLAPAEASSNLAKYDGVRYGNPASTAKQDGDVVFATVRGENLGEEVKRRILLGSFTLSDSANDNYFIQAQRVRRLVKQDFDRVFSFPNLLIDDAKTATDGVDLLLAPTAPSLPPSLAKLADRSALESYTDDVFTVPASLAGLPTISLPAQTGSQSVQGSIGFQLIGQFGSDDFVLNAAAHLAELVRGD